MTVGLDVLVNICLSSVFNQSHTESTKYVSSILVKIGVLVLTHVLLSSLLAQMII